MIKLIVLTVLFILMSLFLGMYETVFLEVYQEVQANRYTDFFGVPVLLIVLIILTVSNAIFWRKWTRDWFSKIARGYITYVLALGIGFVAFIRPVVSGAIVTINTLPISIRVVYVQGTVLAKRQVAGRFPLNELTIASKEGVSLVLTVSKDVCDNYSSGDMFRLELTEGNFGLLYKAKESN